MRHPVKAVLFDAVGTVLFPQPAAAEAYYDMGRRHGSQKSREEIGRCFDAAFARQENVDHAGHGRTDEAREEARWRQIVADVFDDLAETSDLFTSLWEHFAQPRHWQVFADVVLAWQDLGQRVTLDMASNFDARLEAICRGHPPLSQCRRVFYSSALGWRKPFPQFFAAIERALALQPPEILLVGDSLQNDYLPAKAAGWHAILVRREGDLPEQATCVRDLAEVIDLVRSA